MPKVEKVIISHELRGKGTEMDPCRSVLQVYTLDGELLAESDPLFPEPRTVREKGATRD